MLAKQVGGAPGISGTRSGGTEATAAFSAEFVSWYVGPGQVPVRGRVVVIAEWG